MQLKLAKGKSEAIIKYRGDGAKYSLAKLLVRRQDDGVSIIELEAIKGFDKVNLRVVESYEHLGYKISPSSNLAPEAHHRAASSMKCFVALAVREF